MVVAGHGDHPASEATADFDFAPWSATSSTWATITAPAQR